MRPAAAFACLVTFAVGVWVGVTATRTYQPPAELQLRLEPVHIAMAPYPIPLCFGKTVRGNFTVINASTFNYPVVIIGDHTLVTGSLFTGNEWGIYMANGSDVRISYSNFIGSGESAIHLPSSDENELLLASLFLRSYGFTRY